MSRRLVPGDPGSLSAGASTVGRLGTWLSADAEALRAAYQRVGTDWGGPRSLAVRKAGQGLADELSVAGREADTVARALQDHATDLAHLQGQLRAVTERAASVGLELREGAFVPAYGLTGEADPRAETAREQARIEVAAELERLVTLARRRRTELMRTLSQSQARLGQASERLR